MRRALAGVHGGALPTRAPCGGRMWLPPDRKDGPQAPPASVGAATCRGGEITPPSAAARPNAAAPRVGAWIEMGSSDIRAGDGAVAPCTGAWIEILTACQRRSMPSMSPPARGSGVESSLQLSCSKSAGRPLRRRVDRNFLRRSGVVCGGGHPHAGAGVKRWRETPGGGDAAAPRTGARGKTPAATPSWAGGSCCALWRPRGVKFWPGEGESPPATVCGWVDRK